MLTICGEHSKVVLVISKCETELADKFGLELGLDHLMLVARRRYYYFAMSELAAC